MNLITMTPCCRILSPCRSNSFLGLPFKKTLSNSSNFRLNYRQKCDFHSYPPRILGSGRIINRTQKLFCVVPNSSLGRSRVFSSNRYGINPSKRGFHVIASVASDFRNYSTSVEKTRVNDKNFERIYVQGGLNNVKKPLVVEEKADLDEHHAAAIDQHEKIDLSVKEESTEVKEAWKLLENAVVTYCGSPIGTLAANDPNDKLPLNYDQVFIRDFIPSALAFLLKGEKEIVRNFLLHTLQLQSWEKTVDCYSPGQGLMPASFKVRTLPLENNKYEEVLDPDFGESAIGRVAPVDSGLWWIILLRAYGKITGDYGLQERVDVQTGIKLIINLCLSDGFDMFPSLLVTDGSCMIDRRMGIHGHPLEIQALFYSALRCSRELLSLDEGSKNLVNAINNRLSALSFHIREYYWVDMKKINEIYRYKTEEYSTEATNKFNIYPEQIPSWLMDWIPEEGGYLIGNLQPAHMDFRFFTLGNLWSIVSSLGTPKQNEAILNLVEAKWEDLVGLMPLKICYPALESEEWRIITGSDPKNTPWSYHNGGSWPTLLWQFTLACIKMNRIDLAKKAVDLAETRLRVDQWPEYYDTREFSGFFSVCSCNFQQQSVSMKTCQNETDLLNTYFTNGTEVEISSDEDGFRGAWYEGTVVRPIPKKQRRNDDDDDNSGNNLRVLVEYKTLMADKKGKRPLKETMSLVQLRPRPPPEMRRRRFKVSEEVDANYNDGWWEGVVMEVLSDGRYSVFFRGTRDQLEFQESQMRIHREWANGEWTPPFLEAQEEDEEKLVSTEIKPNNEAAEKFNEGSLAEVSSDEEGFEGAWFAATVVKLLDNGNYLIEYQNLRNNDDTDFLQEETDRLHIRPPPPDIGPFESFKVLEEVDALHNDGWWVGVISKVLKGKRYKVYFKANNEELEFKHADIRMHLDWINGKWIRASQALKL